VTPLLQADRAELAQALNLLSSSIGRRGGAEAVFRYKDGLLVISYSGVTASVSATGDGRGKRAWPAPLFTVSPRRCRRPIRCS